MHSSSSFTPKHPTECVLRNFLYSTWNSRPTNSPSLVIPSHFSVLMSPPLKGSSCQSQGPGSFIGYIFFYDTDGCNTLFPSMFIVIHFYIICRSSLNLLLTYIETLEIHIPRIKTPRFHQFL